MNNTETSATAVLLCGHGSRNREAAVEFNCLVEKIQQQLPRHRVWGAFLEFNQPAILDCLQDIYDLGIREVIAQPVTLYNAGHTKHDIPELLAHFSKNHPDVRIRYGSSLGLIDPILEAAVHSIETVMPDGDPENCKLLVIGRGSRDRLIADQTINLCRKLHERLGVGDSRYCYAAESSPRLESALSQAALSHYPQVVVLPFLLFSGRLLADIYAKIDAAAQKYPDFTFHKAPHLGAQNAVAKAVIQKIKEL